MQFTDAVSVAGTRLTDDGYLQADAFCVRTGVQHYRASEVGLAGDHLVAVYRPADEVFSKASVGSFARVPVTMDHPAVPVTAESWKAVAIGETDAEILRDGERLRIPMTIRSADAIRAIQDGKREISAGYTCDLDWTEGATPDGQHYDAIQRDIRANHIAIVAKGRAGTEFRIGDAVAGWGASPITHDEKDVTMADAVKTRTVLIDGLSVETTDAGAQALEKLTKTIADKDAAIAGAQTAHDKALAAKDADMAKKDAEIADLKGKVLSDADLDKRVQDRADLVGKAAALVKDFDAAGKSDTDIRKAVVIAKRGAAMADKSAAYIDAAFDLLVEDAGDEKADPVRAAMKDGGGKVVTLDSLYDERDKALSEAWKQPVKKGA